MKSLPVTMRDEDIRQRLELGEDSRWEFKQVEFAGSRPTSPSRDDLAAEMIALANSNGGRLLIGVTDDGLLQGISREQMAALDDVLVAKSPRPSIRRRRWCPGRSSSSSLPSSSTLRPLRISTRPTGLA